MAALHKMQAISGSVSKLLQLSALQKVLQALFMIGDGVTSVTAVTEAF